jgi:hypothetical protein
MPGRGRSALRPHRSKEQDTKRATARLRAERLAQLFPLVARALRAAKRAPTLVVTVNRVWEAWLGKQGQAMSRTYLLGIIRLHHRAAAGEDVAAELRLALRPEIVFAHLPTALARDGALQVLKRRLPRLTELQPRHVGRPRSESARGPDLFDEVQRLLPRLGLSHVHRRSLLRDWKNVVGQERRGPSLR